MREQYRDVIKTYFRAELLKTRHKLAYSQEEMAYCLAMSTRAYVALEGGRSCCGLLTFIIFLCRCCLDKQAFLAGLFALFEDSDVA